MNRIKQLFIDDFPFAIVTFSLIATLILEGGVFIISLPYSFESLAKFFTAWTVAFIIIYLFLVIVFFGVYLIVKTVIAEDFTDENE